MTQQLFSCSRHYRAPKPDDLRLDTPLGTVNFGARVGHVDIATHGYAVFDLPGGRVLAVEADLLSMELAICRIEPVLPKGLAVDECWGAVLRYVSERSSDSGLLRCQLLTETADIVGGLDCGEGVYAKTWSSNEYTLTMGSEDADALFARAKSGESLPPELADHFTRMAYEDALYDSDIAGLGYNLPASVPGLLCQYHILIAWSKDSEDSVGTSAAVDQSAEYVASQCCPAASHATGI